MNMDIVGIKTRNTQSDYVNSFEVIKNFAKGEIHDLCIDINKLTVISCAEKYSDGEYRFSKSNISGAQSRRSPEEIKEYGNYGSALCNYYIEYITRNETPSDFGKKKDSYSNRDDLKFVLFIDAEDSYSDIEDIGYHLDIINLQYFISAITTIDKTLSERIYIIFFNFGSDNYFRCSDFLSQVVLSDENLSFSNTNGEVCDDNVALYNRIFFYDERHCKRLALGMNEKRISSYKNILPLLKIDKNLNRLFSQSVSNVYSEKWEWQTIESFICHNLLAYRNEICCNNGRFDNKKFQYDILKSLPLRILIDNKILTERNLDESFDLYKDMPFLSFILFTYYIQNSELNSGLISEKEKMEYIGMIQDITLGLLQLMDNIEKHSNMGYGFLGIRFYNKKGNNVLNRKYYNFFQSNKQTYNCFLEITINDLYEKKFSDKNKQLSIDDIGSREHLCIMKDVFLKNLQNRIKQMTHPNNTGDSMKKFFSSFQYASLSDFFDPRELSSTETKNIFSIKDWDEYYSVLENTLYHYGLMQFTSIIKIYNGFFSVNSNKHSEFDETCHYSSVPLNFVDKEKFIPGTQYSLLLPIELMMNQVDTGMDINHSRYNYDDISSYVEEKIEYICDFEGILEESNSESIMIKKYSSIIENKYLKDTDEKKVYSFDFSCCDNKKRANSIKARELFIKSLIYQIRKREELVPRSHPDEELHICIYNCSEVILFQIVELFCAFYNRFGQCSSMMNTRIYLVSKDCRNDFLITGESLLSAIGYSETECMTKGRFNHLHTALSQKIWARYRDNDISNVSTLPYELIIKPKTDNKTAFEESIIETLNTDIQDIDMGCCIKDSHVMIGSKIHILGKFYESEVLFNYKRYIKGFSYLICEIIHEKLSKIDKIGRLILIGYENYSEQLIFSVRGDLYNTKVRKEKDFGIETVICENIANQNHLSFRKDFKEVRQEDKLIIIVPINSTLSTQNKIIASLREQSDFKHLLVSERCIIANIGVVLVRDTVETNGELSDIEKKYWDETKTDFREKTISTNNLFESEFKYLVSVETKWANPLECEFCFPLEELYKERPLIGTNKASVVPMQLIGLKKEQSHIVDSKENVKEITEKLIKKLFKNNEIERAHKCFAAWKSEKNLATLNLINQSLLDNSIIKYGHSTYNDNHFQFFFDTDKLFKRIFAEKSIKSTMKSWSKILRAKIKRNRDITVYNIVFIPEHSLNGEWANFIVKKVFPENPVIISFDVMGEFRENFKAKFSNISGLYDNLRKIRKSAKILFHYVDGTINSGTVFYRAKSLIRSLFPIEAFNSTSIQIEVFSSIILLMSRCSNSTKTNYIDKDYFHSFLEYNIPNMRNHGDACYLCGLEEDFKKLYAMSATNLSADYWKKNQKKVKLRDIQDKYFSEVAEDTLRNRVYCLQRIYLKLSDMGPDKNHSDNLHDALLFLLNDDIGNKRGKTQKSIGKYISLFISYMKVLSRPFLIYRKSFFEASLTLRIELLEEILSLLNYIGDYASYEFKNISLKKVFDRIMQNNREEVCYQLAKTLVQQLGRNHSNYIFRAKVINQFLENKVFIADQYFFNWYSHQIKRSIVLNRDESKSLWFEYLLLNNKELNSGTTSYIKEKNRSLFDVLYLENTRILYNGIKDLSKNNLIDEVETILSSQINDVKYYYLSNFITFVKYCYSKNNTDMVKNTKGMIKLYEKLKEKTKSNDKNDNHLSSRGNSTFVNDTEDIKEYYNDLVECIQETSNAKSVLLFGISEKEDELRYIKKDIFELFGGTESINDQYIKEFLSDKKSYKPYLIGEYVSVSNSYESKQIDTIKKKCTNELKIFVNNEAKIQYENIANTVFIKKSENIAIIKIELSEDELYDKKVKLIEPIYILLDYSENMNDHFHDSIIQYARNILVFRNSFVDVMEEDFNNGLMEAFKHQNDLTEYLSTSSAAGHTTDVDIDRMVGSIGSADEKRIRSMGIGALADQFCGHQYNKLLKESENGYVYVSLESGGDITHTREIMEIFENTEFQWIDNDDRTCSIHIIDGTDGYKTSDESRTKYLIRKSYIVLFLTLFITNAIKHNTADFRCIEKKNGIGSKEYLLIEISIEIRNESMCYFKIKNNSNDSESAERMVEAITTSPSRTEGITLWTTNEILKRALLREYWEQIKDYRKEQIDFDKIKGLINNIKQACDQCLIVEKDRKISEESYFIKYSELVSKSTHRINSCETRTGIALLFPFGEVVESEE